MAEHEHEHWRQQDRPRTPEARHRGALDGGTPLVVEGVDWLLPEAEGSAAFDPIRDRLFDHQTLTGTVLVADLREAAYLLLWLNYDLGPEEIAVLLDRAEDEALGAAVLGALFGPEHRHRTYTAWWQSALWANAIDPASVPAGLVPFVVRQLVRTGRAEPSESFIESSEAAKKRRRIMESLGGGAGRNGHAP